MSFTYPTLYLNRRMIESIALPMARILEVVEDALIEKAHGRVQMPSKHWMERDADRWFGGMSSLVPKVGCPPATLRPTPWASGSPRNSHSCAAPPHDLLEIS